jgi:hypothetical protein
MYPMHETLVNTLLKLFCLTGETLLCDHAHMKNSDLLEQVQAKLRECPDSVSKVGEAASVNRGTVWRIKQGNHDPYYSHVKALAVYFGIIKKPKQPVED